MIGSLRGTIIERDAGGEVLVEVAGTGLGHRVVMGPAAAIGIGEVGDQVFVWVHHHIREDAQILYGFATRAERSSFEALLGAHGVGPALALAILSVHAPDELSRVVADEDAGALCLVPGVGKKTAARLLIELKFRLEPAAMGSNGAPVAPRESGRLEDVHSALENLGYRGEEITETLRLEAVRDAEDTSAAVRAALRHLGARR